MNLTEHLGQWLRGNTDAIDLVLAVHDVVEVWDDLIDKDAEIRPEAINAVFYAALVTIPRNRFYKQHFDLLNPIIEAAILDWHTANALETRKTNDDLRNAYVLKCTGQLLTVLCARIIGGVNWARSVNLKIRSLGETWAEYSAEFGEK